MAARNVISGNVTDNVLIDGSSNLIEGNFIGTNATGFSKVSALTTGNGVEISGSSNTLGGSVAAAQNIIAGNPQDGILIDGTGSGNQVQGNLVGLNASGNPLGNSGNGIEISSTSIFGASNTLGGTTYAARNVVSGNGGDGILLDKGASGNTLLGNYVGISQFGTFGEGNGANGIEINDSTLNTIGGTVGGNVVSGNAKDGILLDNGSTGNLVQGDTVGVNAGDGSLVANGSDGIEINAANGNTIGGTAAGARNFLSGNKSDGLAIDNGTSGTLVQGNFIGAAPGGGALSNGGYGISVNGGNNTIGGSIAGARNYVSHDLTGGILVSTGNGNTLSRNQVFLDGSAQKGPGIVVEPGSNKNLAAPNIDTATITGSTLTVTGSFTAPTVNVNYVLEFFCAPTTDPEGEFYIGSLTIKPSVAGKVSFTLTTPVFPALKNAPLLTATLTDQLGDTSAFSNGVVS